MIKKKSLYFLMVTVFVMYLGSNCLIGQDKVLDYAVDLLNKHKVEVEYDKEGEPISIGNSVVDINYCEVARCYYGLGYQDKALHLFEKIVLDDHRYEFLLSILNSSQEMTLGTEKKILVGIKKIKSISYRIILYADICKYFIKLNKKKGVSRALAELHKTVKKKDDQEEYYYKLQKMLSLSVLLKRNGYDSFVEGIIKEVEPSALEEKDYLLLSILLEQYYALGLKKKIDYLIKKIEEIVEVGSYDDLQFSMLLVKMQKFQLCKKRLTEAFESYAKIKDSARLTSKISEVFRLHDILNKPMILNFLGKNESIKQTVKDSIILKDTSITVPDEGVRKTLHLLRTTHVIEFLVKTGNYREAKEVAVKLSKTNSKKIYTEYFYYCLGKIYYDSNEIESVVSIVEQIEDRNLAIDLLLKVAKYYREQDEESNYLKVMKKAVDRLEKPDSDLFLFGKATAVLDGYLDGGCIHEALRLYKEVDECRDNVSLFRISGAMVKRGDISGAEKLSKTAELKYKASIMSKIGAYLIYSDEPKKGIEYFKKSIRLLIDGTEVFVLSENLENYLIAQKYLTNKKG